MKDGWWSCASSGKGDKPHFWVRLENDIVLEEFWIEHWGDGKTNYKKHSPSHITAKGLGGCFIAQASAAEMQKVKVQYILDCL